MNTPMRLGLMAVAAAVLVWLIPALDSSPDTDTPYFTIGLFMAIAGGLAVIVGLAKITARR